MDSIGLLASLTITMTIIITITITIIMLQTLSPYEQRASYYLGSTLVLCYHSLHITSLDKTDHNLFFLILWTFSFFLTFWPLSSWYFCHFDIILHRRLDKTNHISATFSFPLEGSLNVLVLKCHGCQVSLHDGKWAWHLEWMKCFWVSCFYCLYQKAPQHYILKVTWFIPQ